MPHTRRKMGESGFYHVVAKGDGGQIIFENDEHRKAFMNHIAQALDDFAVRIHAYCLMDNHVHLLVEDSKCEMGSFMKECLERYAMYFARQAKRVGHVFKGRYWSEPIETDEYFLAALRYIHMNPETAGLSRVGEYSWSSYQAYLGAKSFVATELALSLLGGVEGFETFHAMRRLYARPFPDSRLQRHLSNDELMRIACREIGREALTGMRMLRPINREPLLMRLASCGLTESEIARLTGLGRTAVHRVCVKKGQSLFDTTSSSAS